MTTIQWNKLPDPTIYSWYEFPHARNRISATVFAASVFSVVAGFTGVKPFSSRYFIINSCLFSGFAYLLRRIPLSLPDPGSILSVREHIRRNLQSNCAYGLKDIPAGYLTTEEISTILFQDLQANSFSIFINKHGQNAVSVLNESSLLILKLKFIDFLKDQDITEVLFHMGHYPRFQVSKEEMAPAMGRSLMERKASAEIFVQSFTSSDASYLADWVSAITDPDVLEYIAQLKREALADEKLLFKVKRLLASDDAFKPTLRQIFLSLPFSQQTEEDREALGIPLEEFKRTLQARWTGCFTEAAFPDREGFFASLGVLFSPEEWSSKILKETKDLKVTQIVFQWPDLFEKRVLKGESALPNESCIRERLEQEITHLESWEEVVKYCPQAVRWGLLNPPSLQIAHLITSYFYRYPYMLLGELDCKDFVFTADLLQIYQKEREFYEKQKALLVIPIETHLQKWKEKKDQCENDLRIIERLIQHACYRSAKYFSYEGAMTEHERFRRYLDLIKAKIAAHEVKLQNDLLLLKNRHEKEVQSAILCQQGDWNKIKNEIEKIPDLCIPLAKKLLEKSPDPTYTALKQNFVRWIEEKALNRQLSLSLAWAINSAAESLFKDKFHFYNNGSATDISINTFLILTLSFTTQSYLQGFLSGFNESTSQIIRTSYDPKAFEGLMEFYRTGKISQFIEAYRKNALAINLLLELADSLLLPDLTLLIEEEFSVEVELPVEVCSEKTK